MGASIDNGWWLVILGSWFVPMLFRALLQAMYGYSNPMLTPFIKADWLDVLPVLFLAAYGVRVAWRRRRRAAT